MSSIISLAIVDNNVDPKGIGRIRVKLTGTPTGPIEKSREYFNRKNWVLLALSFENETG